MTVVEHRVCVEVFHYFAEARFQRSLAAGAAHTGLRVAYDPCRSVDQARIDQWPDREVRSRRIAPRIRDQACPRDIVPAEFRQTVSRLCQECRLAMFGLVPLLISVSRAQTECAAQ